jgi:hypothetical protein
LISKLNYQISNTSNFEEIKIGVTNGATTIFETNMIFILNSYKSPPQFVTLQRTFEIKEVRVFINEKIHFSYYKKKIWQPTYEEIIIILNPEK